MSKARRYTPKQPIQKATTPILLYILLLPLVLALTVSLFRTNLTGFGISALILILYIAVIKLSKKGFAQEFEYNNNHLTKAPAIPYKMLSGILLGVTTAVSALMASEHSVLNALFLALVATAGYYLYYGFDPRDDKLENLGDISADVALKSIKEAEHKLSKIRENLDKIDSRSLKTKISLAVTRADNIIANLKEDPKDIRVARKFLIVYVDGLQKVTDSFVSLDEELIKEQTKQRLHTLLDDIQDKFESELKRLKENNHFDLDVSIDVLQEQIKN